MSVMKRLGCRRGVSYRPPRLRPPMRPRPSAAMRLLMSILTTTRQDAQQTRTIPTSRVRAGAAASSWSWRYLVWRSSAPPAHSAIAPYSGFHRHSISKANKIAPVSLCRKNATNTNEAGTTTGSTENLVSPEQQSVKPGASSGRFRSCGPRLAPQRPAAATPPGAVQMAPNQAMPGPTSVWPPPPAIAAPTAPTAAAPIPAPPAQVLSEPKKIHRLRTALINQVQRTPSRAARSCRSHYTWQCQ